MSQSQILEAARQLDTATIRRLLSTRPELIRAADRGGRSLLQLACLARCKELGVPSSRALAVAALLFEHGVDVESGLVTREGHYVNSVWFAIRGGNPRLISFLIGRGAKPCGLFSAGWQENVQAIGLLLDAGSQIDEVVDGETPFLHCWKNRKFRSAQFLIDRGANPNFQDPRGRQPCTTVSTRDSIHLCWDASSAKVRHQTLPTRRAVLRGRSPRESGTGAIQR